MFRSAAIAIFAFVAAAAAGPAFTALPVPFDIRNPPVNWTATGPDSLTIAAGPKTNWFVPPWDPTQIDDNAPTLLVRPGPRDFTLSAKVALTPKSRWDSGALTVFVDNDNWAKLCLENANGDGKLQVVMVVNKGRSDDSYTEFAAPEGALYFRIDRAGTAIFFNASHDGVSWTMLRAFTLGGDLAHLKTGLLAQSPTGGGMTVTFSSIHYEIKK
jgi:uncharacterized protein